MQNYTYTFHLKDSGTADLNQVFLRVFLCVCEFNTEKKNCEIFLNSLTRRE